jgi:hypothetical protein
VTGKTVYVADQDGTVTPIATATNKPGKPTKIGPAQTATRPRRKRTYSCPLVGDRAPPLTPWSGLVLLETARATDLRR